MQLKPAVRVLMVVNHIWSALSRNPSSSSYGVCSIMYSKNCKAFRV